MAEIEIGGTKAEVIASAWTLVLYEQEFGKDCIHELFANDDGSKGFVEKKGKGYTFNFDTVNWPALMRTYWACLKTADDSIPGFKKWARDAAGINLIDLRLELYPIITEGFFPTGDGGSR